MDLTQGAREFGLELNADQRSAFETYRAELLAWNTQFNLTTITDPDDVTGKHFLDSLSCLTALPRIDGRSVSTWLSTAPVAVDVGAGAGFPGLPLKIVWPGLRLTLVESTGKKCRFLNHMVQVLDLNEVTVVNSRVEDFGQRQGRDAFDLALARAVSRLPTLLEYTLPLLRLGGWLIAQKGQNPLEELEAATLALNTLGGSLHDAIPVAVPGLDAHRTLVVINKAAPTPAGYPRRAGLPKRQPIL
jgi:16S rRNA (guanine527-N7)-methyltransferase